jgi:hypothetical protein
MSQSNRLLYVALGGCLAALLWVGAGLGQEAKPPVLDSQPIAQENRGADKGWARGESTESNTPAEKLTPALNQISSAIRSLIKQQRAAQTQDPGKHQISDLEAQQDMVFGQNSCFSQRS